MSAEANKAMIREFMERAFNQGDLTVVDEYLGTSAVDHQESLGVNFRNHLKQVISGLRRAFPDLRFELHDVLAEGDIVAFRSTMTGTHLGTFQMGAGPELAATGRTVRVAHMHFVKVIDGKGQDLWHLWDTPGLMRQMQAAAAV